MDSVWAIGDCAAAPDPRGGLCRRPPSTRSAKGRSLPAISLPSWDRPRGSLEYRGNAAFVNLGRYKAVGKVGGRTFRGFPAWWMARTYHMSQIPGAARKARAVIDWTASMPFRRDISEVGSIGHPKPLEATIGPWDSSTSSSPSSSAYATEIIGKGKGSSFWVWLLVGMVLPGLGLIAVILYRTEKTNPNASAPTAARR